ncbi:MAG: PqqD family protein [Lachnospiraceae bacterium]|nr:PqqD family protein [Lachnospiraceae bacterium]
MRLKRGYTLYKDGNDYMLVTDGSNIAVEDLIGYINESAYAILDMLSQSDGNLTTDDLVDCMLEQFDAPREVLATDVGVFMARLQELGLVE